MNHHRLTIHIDTIQAGQPRAYADSIYENVLTYEGNGPLLPGASFRPAESLVKRHARVLVHEWNDEPNWHDDRLDFVREEKPGVWRVRVISPYLD